MGRSMTKLLHRAGVTYTSVLVIVAVLMCFNIASVSRLESTTEGSYVDARPRPPRDIADRGQRLHAIDRTSPHRAQKPVTIATDASERTIIELIGDKGDANGHKSQDGGNSESNISEQDSRNRGAKQAHDTNRPGGPPVTQRGKGGSESDRLKTVAAIEKAMKEIHNGETRGDSDHVKINESLKEDLRRKLNTPGKQTGHAANQEVGADDAITRIETGNVLSILHSSGLLIDSGVKEEVHRILSGGNPSLLEGLSVAIKHTTVAQCMQRESSWAVLDVVDTLRGFTMAVHRAKEDRFGHRYRFPETHPALGSYRLAEALADVVRIMLDNYARRKDSIFVDVTTGLGLSSLNAAHSGYNTLMINGHKVHTAMVRVSACLQNISITQSDETIQYHTARPQGSLIPVVSGIGPTRRACGVLYDLDDFSDVRLSCNSDSQHHLSAAVWDATGHKRILQGKENVNTLDSQLGDRSVSVLKIDTTDVHSVLNDESAGELFRDSSRKPSSVIMTLLPVDAHGDHTNRDNYKAACDKHAKSIRWLYDAGYHKVTSVKIGRPSESGEARAVLLPIYTSNTIPFTNTNNKEHAQIEEFCTGVQQTLKRFAVKDASDGGFVVLSAKRGILLTFERSEN